MRLYTPTQGHIYYNDIDIQTLDFQDYIRHIALSFRISGILNFSVAENIAFGGPPQPEKLQSIIQEVGLKDTLSRLPNGLETPMGRQFDSNGTELSGGQQQKLAIARALYKDASLIVLDEPTAMLSPKAEYDIYNNFHNLTKNKTTIYISPPDVQLPVL